MDDATVQGDAAFTYKHFGLASAAVTPLANNAGNAVSASAKLVGGFSKGWLTLLRTLVETVARIEDHFFTCHPERNEVESKDLEHI